MSSNGVILLNLNNRNAADFQRLEVPDSYEKASGALTAGTYVTVYKWLYQGFMMAPSLCNAVDADDHINLVDRTNGGILEVYPDDTIEILSGPAPGPDPEPEPEPEPEPLILVPLIVSEPGFYDPSVFDADGFSNVTVLNNPPRATRVWTHSTGGSDASVYMQYGKYENDVFVPYSDAVDVLYTRARDWVGHGIVQVKYDSGWSVRGILPVQFDGDSYSASQVITTWGYNTAVDYLFIEVESNVVDMYRVVFTKTPSSVSYLSYGYRITNKIPSGGIGAGGTYPSGEQSSVATLTAFNEQLPITVQYKQYMDRWVWAINPQRAYSFIVNPGTDLTDSSVDPSSDPGHYSIVTGVLQPSSNRYFTADTDRFELLLWEY